MTADTPAAMAPAPLDAALLSRWPLPLPADDVDKDARGRLLIIGGSREIPGALLLAANGALRAGTGKLTLATGASVATGVALAIPEARVIALPELGDGGFSATGIEMLHGLQGRVDAVLLGPGMQDERASSDFAAAVLQLFDAAVILDAVAMNVLHQRRQGVRWRCRALALTPHAGELAHLTGLDKDEIVDQGAVLSPHYASMWNAVLVLKGARTHISTPQGQSWVHQGGTAGLATSGSGDTLAGIIAGLAARGVELAQACAWGVVLHAAAGERLAARVGSLGYLARELAAEVPALLDELARPVPTADRAYV